jgi:hypothetical protein
MRRRIVRTRVTLVVLAILLSLTFLTGWQLIWPTTTAPDRIDVVLVLAGGTGEREATGARLAREGVARCRLRLDGVRVVCLTPQVPTTRARHLRRA